MMRLISPRVSAILQEPLFQCLSWQIVLKPRNSDLYDRLLEESRWGLNWVLGTRFGDGYRDGGMIVGIWTDNVIGTKDDMETPAKNDPSDNFISSITTSHGSAFLCIHEILSSQSGAENQRLKIIPLQLK